MREFAIFNNEGCLERDLWRSVDANRALAQYTDDPEAYADALCQNHDYEEQPASSCELCEEEEN